VFLGDDVFVDFHRGGDIGRANLASEGFLNGSFHAVVVGEGGAAR